MLELPLCDIHKSSNGLIGLAPMAWNLRRHLILWPPPFRKWGWCPSAPPPMIDAPSTYRLIGFTFTVCYDTAWTFSSLFCFHPVVTDETADKLQEAEIIYLSADACLDNTNHSMPYILPTMICGASPSGNVVKDSCQVITQFDWQTHLWHWFTLLFLPFGRLSLGPWEPDLARDKLCQEKSCLNLHKFILHYWNWQSFPLDPIFARVAYSISGTGGGVGAHTWSPRFVLIYFCSVSLFLKQCSSTVVI